MCDLVVGVTVSSCSWSNALGNTQIVSVGASGTYTVICEHRWYIGGT